MFEWKKSTRDFVAKKKFNFDDLQKHFGLETVPGFKLLDALHKCGLIDAVEEKPVTKKKKK